MNEEMHLQCRPLAYAQVINESQDQEQQEKNKRLTLRHLHTLKIDLIGMTEKMAKISHEKIMVTTKNEVLKSSLNSHEQDKITWMDRC